MSERILDAEISVRNLRVGAVVIFSVAAIPVAASIGLLNPWSQYFLCLGVFVLILKDASQKGALHLSLFLMGLVLYVFPYLGELIRGSSVSMEYFVLFLPVVWILSVLSPSPNRALSDEPIRAESVKVIIFLALAVAGLHLWKPLYAAGYAFALFAYDRLSRSRCASSRAVIVHGALFYLCLAYNYLFIWSGFGRLEFLTYLALPLLVASHYKRIEIKNWQVAFLMFFGIAIGQAIRGVVQPGLMTFATGSVSHHLLLMDELGNDKALWDARFHELFDQFLLYFLNWFPRELWVEKPLGIGSWFVDVYIGRDGFSDAHSVSLGFWGEHIFLNPDGWVLSGLMVLVVTVFMSRLFYRLDNGGLPLVLMFNANFLTLFWGGMASFGSRVWWLVLPAFFYVIARRFALR
jgi:hypothetical protein